MSQGILSKEALFWKAFGDSLQGYVIKKDNKVSYIISLLQSKCTSISLWRFFPKLNFFLISSYQIHWILLTFHWIMSLLTWTCWGGVSSSTGTKFISTIYQENRGIEYVMCHGSKYYNHCINDWLSSIFHIVNIGWGDKWLWQCSQQVERPETETLRICTL